jgi:hypothetical protein
MNKGTLRIESSNGSHEVQISFPDEEWALLQKYSQYVHELRHTNAYREPLNVSTNIRITPEQGLTYDVSMPDWEKVIVILHRLRPFLLENESTYFNRIRSILGRRVDDKNIKSLLKYNKDIFLGKHMRGMMIIKIDDVILNSEEFLTKWLNAFEYHRDDEKRRFIEQIHEAFPMDITKSIFVSLIIDKIKAIDNVCGIIDLILGNIKEFVVK